MHKYYGAVPMVEKHDKKYSNHSPQSIGYEGNDKGHVNREREADKNWSQQQMLETGLVDREKM